MAVKETKAAETGKAKRPPKKRELIRTQAETPVAKRSSVPSPRARREHGPSPADRYNGWALAATLLGWLLLLLGERVLVAKEGLSTFCTMLGVTGLLAGFAQRVWALSLSATDRLRAARTFAVLSGIGLLALAIYYATTDGGRELFGVDKPRLGEPDLYGDVLTATWIILLLVSVVPSILGELARRPMIRAERVESRRIVAATVAGISLALAAAYGSLFTFTAGKLEVMADFSFFRASRPSDSTQRMVESLQEPLTVRVWFPEHSEVKTKVVGYLRDLQSRTALLEIEERDRFLDPELAKEDKVRKDGVLTLVHGKKAELVDIGVDEGAAARKLRTLDGEFQEALHKVMRDKLTVYMTVGHGELYEENDSKSPRANRAIRELIELQNYQHKKLGLGEGLGDKVPDDASMVMVLGPTSAFRDTEVESLREYAERGGSVLMALDPEDKAELAPVAAAVGIKWEPNLVLNEQILVRMKRNESDKRILVGKRFSSHPAVSTLSKFSVQGAAVLLPGAAPLDKVEGLDKAYNVDFAVKSMPNCFVDLDANFSFDEGAEKKNTFNLVAAVSKKIDDSFEMRGFVVGDVEVFTDPLMDWRPNQVFFAEALRWLGREESFSGQIESEEDVRIVHTEAEDQVWFYTTILGVPSAVLAVGLVLTLRTRKRKKEKPRDRLKAGTDKPRTKPEKKAAAAADASKAVDAPAEDEAVDDEASAAPEEDEAAEDEPEADDEEDAQEDEEEEEEEEEDEEDEDEDEDAGEDDEDDDKGGSR